MNINFITYDNTSEFYKNQSFICQKNYVTNEIKNTFTSKCLN